MNQSMKLVDILAREIKVWPNDFRGDVPAAITQDIGGRLNTLDAGYKDCPGDFSNGVWSSKSWTLIEVDLEQADDYETAIVTREQWQAAVDALKASAWSGEGLPPVGVVCEVFDCTHEYTKKFNGQAVEIVAHHTGLAVFSADDGEYHGLVASKFRPIRTAEQIAAEKRDQAIQEMTESRVAGGLAPWVCGELYDAGYRKQADQ